MSLETVVQTIEADISAEWGVIAAAGEADALAAWGAVKPVLLGILPAQWTILKSLIQTGIQDIESLSIEDTETALLNLAITDELTFIKNLESSALQAIIALFKTSV